MRNSRDLAQIFIDFDDPDYAPKYEIDTTKLSDNDDIGADPFDLSFDDMQEINAELAALNFDPSSDKELDPDSLIGKDFADETKPIEVDQNQLTFDLDESADEDPNQLTFDLDVVEEDPNQLTFNFDQKLTEDIQIYDFADEDTWGPSESFESLTETLTQDLKAGEQYIVTVTYFNPREMKPIDDKVLAFYVGTDLAAAKEAALNGYNSIYGGSFGETETEVRDTLIFGKLTDAIEETSFDAKNGTDVTSGEFYDAVMKTPGKIKYLVVDEAPKEIYDIGANGDTKAKINAVK